MCADAEWNLTLHSEHAKIQHSLSWHSVYTEEQQNLTLHLEHADVQQRLYSLPCSHIAVIDKIHQQLIFIKQKKLNVFQIVTCFEKYFLQKFEKQLALKNNKEKKNQLIQAISN